MFTIEKNIPITSRSRNKYKDFLETLEVGDSFLIPTSRNPKMILPNMYGVAKKARIKIRTKAEADGSVRVWRVG